MKKKLLLSLIILIAFLSTGCTEDEKKGFVNKIRVGATYYCNKEGIDKETTTGIKYTLGLKEVAAVNDYGKLTYYSSKATYTFNSEEECETSCNTAKRLNDDYNSKNDLGLRKITNCACDKQEFSEEFVYEDISKIDESIRNNIPYLNDEDNTFYIDNYLYERRENGYICK